MNLTRLRWSLTAWFVGMLLVIVLLSSLVVYLTTAHLLGNEVDNSLRSGAFNVASQVNEEFVEASSVAAASGMESERDELRYLTGAAGDNLFAVFLPTGELLDNPLNLKLSDFFDQGALQEAIDQGASWRTAQLPQGTYRIFYLPVRQGSRTIAIVGAGQSLTEQRHELSELLLVLIGTGGGGIVLALAGGFVMAGRALAPSRRAFEQQRSFIADASHELRSPLTLIRASAEALDRERPRLKPEDIEAVDNILTETDSMSALVNDLLDLARLDEGQMVATREWCDLSSLLEDAERFARVAVGSRHLAVILDREVGQLSVRVDEGQIRRVLRILLENAIRLTPDVGTIRLAADLLPGTVRVSVSDTGPGLAQEELSAVFDRFYRADKARSHAEGGAGLGLAIAKGIIEAHGGRIWVESVSGYGATFYFTLPMRTEPVAGQ